MTMGVSGMLRRVATVASPSVRWRTPLCGPVRGFFGSGSRGEDSYYKPGPEHIRDADFDEEGHEDGHDASSQAPDSNSLLPPGSIPLPKEVMVVPLYRRPVFPGIMTPILVQDADLIKAISSNMDSGRTHVGLFLVHDSEESGTEALEQEADRRMGSSQDSSLPKPEKITSVDRLYKVGSIARVIRVQPTKGGGAQILMTALERICIEDSVPDVDPLSVRVNVLKTEPYDKSSKEIKAYTAEIISTIKEIIQMNPFFKDQLQTFLDLVDINNASQLADLGGALTTAEGPKLQEILETLDITSRLHQSLTLLKTELDTSRIQQKISMQLNENISKSQRRYTLMEQMKLIKKELGLEKDDKEQLLKKFEERIAALELPPHAEKVIKDEMSKLGLLEAQSAEFNTTRNYLEWLTGLPWGLYSEENLDVSNAETVLNEDHYGLEDVKERILEFIAVGSLRKSVQGKIICLVGPPGVGKTSIGRSVARALNREFYRFSVGGLGDVAEIKGHRRTYVGAMPGKLIQCLKTTQKSNPVIMIDEIDKLGRGHHGDPAPALLEVLDPEQNTSFLDHFLDVPYDLSKVLFITTANMLDTIQKPLLDRMEVIRLSGYVLEEKMSIAKTHLIPNAIKESGIDESKVTIEDSAVEALCQFYCREAGVRNLQKHVEKIFRKCAYKFAKGYEGTLVVNRDNLEEFVGKRVFTSDRFYSATPPGVTMGLAWTAMGGSTLYIETTTVRYANPHSENSEPTGAGQASPSSRPPSGSLKVTGQLGSVMQESSDIAYTFARHFYFVEVAPKDSSLDPAFFDQARIHMHVPEGATPKDGPSAGVTMITSLLSLAMNRPVRANLAMTGEVSLTGKVLPIGGVKEKIIAARRSGVEVVCLPEANRKDWDELQDYIKDGLEVHFVEDYIQLFAVAFPEV